MEDDTASVEPEGGARPARGIHRGGGGEALARRAHRLPAPRRRRLHARGDRRRAGDHGRRLQVAAVQGAREVARPAGPSRRCTRRTPSIQPESSSCRTSLLNDSPHSATRRRRPSKRRTSPRATSCARERAAYRALVAMAHDERGAIGIPLTRFESIASALAAEPPLVAPARPPSCPTAMRGRAASCARRCAPPRASFCSPAARWPAA